MNRSFRKRDGQNEMRKRPEQHRVMRGSSRAFGNRHLEPGDAERYQPKQDRSPRAREPQPRNQRERSIKSSFHAVREMLAESRVQAERGAFQRPLLVAYIVRRRTVHQISG